MALPTNLKVVQDAINHCDKDAQIAFVHVKEHLDKQETEKAKLALELLNTKAELKKHNKNCLTW